jgi:hypothetical protein
MDMDVYERQGSGFIVGILATISNKAQQKLCMKTNKFLRGHSQMEISMAKEFSTIPQRILS